MHEEKKKTKKKTKTKKKKTKKTKKTKKKMKTRKGEGRAWGYSPVSGGGGSASGFRSAKEDVECCKVATISGGVKWCSSGAIDGVGVRQALRYTVSAW